jgi:DNA-binding CsgD family transcriptional regulator
MVDPEILSQLIGSIYDAALDCSLWLSVLEQASRFVGGAAAGMYSKDITIQKGEVYYNWNVDASCVAEYFNKYIRFDPTLTAHLFFPVEDIYSTTDVVPYQEFVETKFYKEWAKPHGWADHLATTLDKSATSIAMFGIFRNEQQGLADENMRRRMRLLVPHMRRSVLVGNVIDLHKGRTENLSDAFNALDASVFLLDGNSRISFSNIAAQSLLDEGNILRATNNVLAVVDPQAARVLREIVTAADGGDGPVGTEGVAIPLSSEADHNWVAHVLPLTSGARRQTGGLYSAAVAVFVRKISIAMPYPIEVAAKHYGLTPSEVRVLGAVLEIGGVSNIAESLGISEATVKTHLQNIFAKTGVRRQADLIKLVAGHASPLRPMKP